MKYTFQEENRLANDFEFSFDAEISYSGIWRSLNDHFNYRVTPNGFGQHDVSFRRKTVNSTFFEGDYLVSAVQDAVKRNWEIRVFGGDAAELQENLANLVGWFTQTSYNVRWRVNEYQETWLCDVADYSIDYTQVQAHNNQLTVKFVFSTHPKVLKEFLL